MGESSRVAGGNICGFIPLFKLGGYGNQARPQAPRDEQDLEKGGSTNFSAVGFRFRVYHEQRMLAARSVSPAVSCFRGHLLSKSIRRCSLRMSKVRCASNGRSIPSFCDAVEFPDPQPGGYGEIGYWNKRYSEQPDATLDWFHGYSYFEPVVRKHISKSARILMPGCGNSAMSEDMVEDGYKEIVNTDLSSVVIENLKAKYAHVPQLSYMTMDACDMSAFGDSSFDAAIDKGLADAMLCGANPAQGVIKMLKEIYRILKPGGVFMLITYGYPLIRMPALSEPGLDWSIVLYVLPKPGSERALEQNVQGTEPEPVAMDNSNWVEVHGGEDNEEKGLTFVYVCTKDEDVAPDTRMG